MVVVASGRYEREVWMARSIHLLLGTTTADTAATGSAVAGPQISFVDESWSDDRTTQVRDVKIMCSGHGCLDIHLTHTHTP